jgi:hypothetical protein
MNNSEQDNKHRVLGESAIFPGILG